MNGNDKIKLIHYCSINFDRRFDDLKSFIYKDIYVKNNNSFLFQQVFAQANATNTNTNNNSSSIAETNTNNNHTNTEQTIARQGIVTSSQSRHNET